MSMVKEMVGKVDVEHRTKLEQLDSMQQEQRCVPVIIGEVSISEIL